MISIFSSIQNSVIHFANWIWGFPLLLLILGGGIFLIIATRFATFRLLRGIGSILRGRYKEQVPTESHGLIGRFNALAAALGTTVGMGNISGIAVAIKIGGPATLFWMWVVAFIGMSIEFFTSTLAIIYRTENKDGSVAAGPMYILINGLGKQWKWLAVIFALAGMVGALPIFQANQLTQAIQEIALKPNSIETNLLSNTIIGIGITLLVSIVIFGGLKKIATVSSTVVPFMIVLYFLSALGVILYNWKDLPLHFSLIFSDAFRASYYTGEHLFGSALGGIMVLGARRITFACESGMGNISMVHGTVKTNNPVQQGTLSMLGPLGTLVVCTLTALALISTDYWHTSHESGIGLALLAFKDSIFVVGDYLLFICAFTFGFTSLIGYSYVGENCFSFLVGKKYKKIYYYLYTASIILGCIASFGFIISIIDSAYAIMAFPTMFVTIMLYKKTIPLIRAYLKK